MKKILTIKYPKFFCFSLTASIYHRSINKTRDGIHLLPLLNLYFIGLANSSGADEGTTPVNPILIRHWKTRLCVVFFTSITSK